MKKALIIFVRNPISGKVKTRLASGIGNEKTLVVYQHLLQYTQSIIKNLPFAKIVCYADFINENDLWNGFEKKLQVGDDLGERMQNAFSNLFSDGYQSVCIIGSDCYDLTEEIINTAFEKLHSNEVVIGPATDGGYYLLGSTRLVPEFFTNKKWSSNSVFTDTINEATQQGLSISTLPLLRDIDDEKDLRNSPIAYLLDK